MEHIAKIGNGKGQGRMTIAVLGVIANTIFWRKYARLSRETGNAILAVQSRLYRAKTLVDTCVTAALVTVALFPGSQTARWLDLGGGYGVRYVESDPYLDVDTKVGQVAAAIKEACARLNELAFAFSAVELDGYKVGGFFAVCNAILEDNDVNLMSEILNVLGKAIGKAVDKAIVYGTGKKMPLGIVPRLAQTEQPANYSPTAREWKNLSATNIITGTGATGVNLFKEIAANTGVIENDYFEGGLIWLMNKKTHTTLTVQSMDKNLNAAIVAGISNTMPVVGGDIVELSFIPEGEIVFGYFDAYLLAERAGTALGQSEHVRFLEDQTAFKGTARYDGHPTIPEAFGVMSITAKAPTTSVEFPADAANAAT